MRSTFGEGIDRLIEAVGTGRLTGKCKVDQVYAHYQHEHAEFRHPRGGKAFYLRDPLFANAEKYMQVLADGLIDTTGSKIKEKMVEVAEDLSREVEANAPVEFADLRASGHPVVLSDGATIYDRAPVVPRLSEAEIRLKQRLGHSTHRHRRTP